MVGDHPWNGWSPSWGWWLTIHGISTGLNFMSYVYVPNSKPVVHFPLVDLGWWVTILWMVGDHPGDGGWTSTLHLDLILWFGMVGDHSGDGGCPSMTLHLVLILCVKSVLHWFQVCSDWLRTILCQTDLDWSWSLTRTEQSQNNWVVFSSLSTSLSPINVFWDILRHLNYLYS